MEISKIVNLSNNYKNQLFSLWNSEYPLEITYKSIKEFEYYLNGLQNPTHFFIKDNSDVILGWSFTFYRDSEVWFGIIIHSDYQGKGYGTHLLNAMKLMYEKLNGWVIPSNTYKRSNGESYVSPLRFYTNQGFEMDLNKEIPINKINVIKIKWHKI